MLFYVPHGQHALERGKYISFCVPLDQDVYKEGNIYCVTREIYIVFLCHLGNTGQ